MNNKTTSPKPKSSHKNKSENHKPEIKNGSEKN